MGHWPSGHQVFALQVIPFSFWWLLSVKASSVWIFHSRVQGRFFSHLRKFPYFSRFMTHYKDLAFKNKTFCFIINLSGEKVWHHTAQMHRHVQRGTQLGEFSCTTPARVSLQNPRQPSLGGGSANSSSCLENFRVEIRMPQHTDSSNISDYRIPGFQSASQVFNSRNDLMPLFEEGTSGN